MLYHAEYVADPVLEHTYEDLSVGVRLPDPEVLAAATEKLERIRAGESVPNMEVIFAFGAVLLQETFGENPVDTLPVHAVRIGDAGIATQPCELYCQFGLDIKRRSPAAITAVFGAAAGYGGYCPTLGSILGGGYSGQAINWCRLVPEAGDRIVDSASALLHGLW